MTDNRKRAKRTCIYAIVYRCKKEAVGVSGFCDEHLKRQQIHAQKKLKWKLERKVKP